MTLTQHDRLRIIADQDHAEIAALLRGLASAYDKMIEDIDKLLDRVHAMQEQIEDMRG